MKQMILTGMATEQRFGSPEPQYYLVFNEGQLRVPVAAEAAEAVVQAMYGGQTTEEVRDARFDNNHVDEDLAHQDRDDYDNEADIPQA
jgi:hypothetical protein